MGTKARYVLICENGAGSRVTRAGVRLITSDKTAWHSWTKSQTLLLHQPFVASGTRLFCVLTNSRGSYSSFWSLWQHISGSSMSQHVLKHMDLGHTFYISWCLCVQLHFNTCFFHIWVILSISHRWIFISEPSDFPDFRESTLKQTK